MQSKRATKKGSLMALVVAVSALLAGVALADKGGKANANADFGQSMAAEARAKGEAMKQDGQDTAAEASGRMKELRAVLHRYASISVRPKQVHWSCSARSQVPDGAIRFFAGTRSAM